VRGAGQRRSSHHAGHEHTCVLLRQGGPEDDGPGDHTQWTGHEVLGGIEHGHLVGRQLQHGQEEQDADKPGILQNGERRVVQGVRAEQTEAIRLLVSASMAADSLPWGLSPAGGPSPLLAPLALRPYTGRIPRTRGRQPAGLPGGCGSEQRPSTHSDEGTNQFR
jgi:hypothetical protein